MTTKATSPTTRKQVEEALRESEENFRNSLDSSHLGIRIITAEGETIYANRAILDIYGYSSIEEFKSIPVVERHTLKSYVERQERVRKRETGKPVPDRFEQSIIRKDGGVRNLEVFNREVLWGGEKQFQLIYHDITDQKRAVEALRESEQKYRSLFESMLNSFAYCKILVDEDNQPIDYVHLEVNDAWERAIGLKREDIIGKKITDVIPGIKESKPDLISIYGKVALTGEETKFELYFEPLGKWFTISVYSPEKGYFIAVFENITERRQADDNPGKPSDEDRSKEQARLASLQKRFVRSGFDALEEEDEIRLVFSLCRYRPECDEKIEKCIKNFKDLRELLSASEEKLQRIGICHRGVFAIRLLRELPEEVLKQKILEKPVYKSPQEIFEYLRYSMRDLEKEVFKVIYLDKRDKIIDTVDLFEGTLDSIPIRPREIMESAIAHNATGLIFAHNHPTGDPTPSKTDKQLTRELVFVGMIMQIKVLDHIIIGEDRYFSFADDKLIEKYEDDFLNLKIRAAFDIEVHPTLNIK